MRRRRTRYNDTGGDILFDEFKFYNKGKNLIDEKILADIFTRLKNGEDEIYWTNELYGINQLIFKFYSKTKEETKITDYYIKLLELNFKVTPENLDGVKEIIENRLFLKFDLTEKQEAIIKDMHYLSNIKTYTYKENEDTGDWLCKTFSNWYEIIDALIKSNIIKKSNYYWDEFKNYYVNFFEDIIYKPKYKIEHTDGKYGWNTHTYHIFKVIEKRIDNKNYRIMLYTHIKGNNDFEYCISVVDEDDQNYNNIDEGFVFILKDNIHYNLAPQLVVKGNDESIFIDLDVCNAIDDNINRIIGRNDPKIISPTVYKFYSAQVKRYNYKDQKLTEMEMRIMEQYKKLLKLDKTIKLDQVFITKTAIYTENNEFNIKFNKEFFDVEEHFITLKREIDKGDARYNFNALYDIILKHSQVNIINRSNTRDGNYKEFVSCKFIVNNMPIEVKKEGNRINICDIFCRIDDTFDILNKAICFNNIDDYRKYIKDVSFIGLEWKKMISSGVHLYLENPLLYPLKRIGYTANDKVILRFSLLWDMDRRSDIYLVMNNQKYLIRYKQKFLKFFDYPGRSIRVSILKEILSESLDNFQEGQIIEIIENAIKEARIVEERGKFLLQETIKETKAIEENITMSNKNVNGFTITGLRTSSKYFIDKIDLNVYRWDDGKWNRRCVVSDPNKQRIYEDRLANRLMNIYNENVRIKTLFN